MRVPTLLVVLPILIGSALVAYWGTSIAVSWVFERWVYPRVRRRLAGLPTCEARGYHMNLTVSDSTTGYCRDCGRPMDLRS